MVRPVVGPVAGTVSSTTWPYGITLPSGLYTDGAHGAIAGANAYDVIALAVTAGYCQVYDTSAASYRALESVGAGDFVQYQLLPNTTQNGDAVYFGHSIPFCEPYFPMSATVSTYTGNALLWEYWTGAAWASLTVHDYTDATAQDGRRSFGRTGALSFLTPTDWASTSVNSIIGYWIRARVTDATKLTVLGKTSNVLHSIIKVAPGFFVPRTGTITAITVRDLATIGHSTADIKFVLFNFTTGARSAEFIFEANKRMRYRPSFTLPIAVGDVLGILVTQQDGVAEMGPCLFELTATTI